ncbi:MAG: DUF58 domain-containing protein [Alphaproteobacteria bacterium]|nr:DUF58 domain-containing protein [Alphaproteobacteria bacterium]
MVEFNMISQLWKKNNRPDLSGLVPAFKDLTDIKKYVPYLQDFNFNTSSNKAGDFKSSFKGRGIEFEEVRSYTFGDDVRDIDWRVTARKNQPFTKLYAQEKDREVYAWLDLSESMRFGTKNELKSVTAAKTAALLGWFALANRDRFGLIVFDGNKTHIFEPKRDYENLLIILKKIEQIATDTLHQTNESQTRIKSLQLAAKRIGKKSILFLISDFNFFHEENSSVISTLSFSNDVCVINVYDNLEDVAPPKGEYMAQYNDVKYLLINKNNEYSQMYQTYFAHKRQILKDFCTKFNCKYRQIRTDLPIFKQLKPL